MIRRGQEDETLERKEGKGNRMEEGREGGNEEGKKHRGRTAGKESRTGLK